MGLEGFNAAENISKNEVRKWDIEDIQALNKSRDKINAALNANAVNEINHKIQSGESNIDADTDKEIESLNEESNKNNLREQSVEANLNAVVNSTPSLLAKLTSLFSNKDKKESIQNFAKMNDIYASVESEIDSRYV